MDKSTPLWVGVLWLVAMATALPVAAAQTEDQARATSLEEQIGVHLAHLDRALENRLHAIDRWAKGEMAEFDRESESFARHLRQIQARIHRLGSEEKEDLLEKSHSIDLKIRALAGAEVHASIEKSASTERRSGAVLRQPFKGGLPANDDCVQALPIGNGSYVGSTSGASNDGSSFFCGGADTPDVWFRYSSAVGGTVFANTFGSDFDTVLSVHAPICPVTRENERTCNDNAIGLQSAVDFQLDPGEEVLIRISGFAGASGQFSFQIGVGGALSGRVTDGATGDSLPSIEVSVFAEQDAFAGSALTDPAGNYTIAGLPSGTYSAIAGTSTHFIPELFENLPCLDGRCDLSNGTPIEVNINSLTQGIDFTLDLGGSLRGRVTDAATGEPLAGVDLELADAAGETSQFAFSDQAGHYTFNGLPTGNTFVRAASSEFRDELFDDIPCPGSDCEPSSGTAIPVALGETTARIDFALDRLGSISGVVTDETTGEPIPFIIIEVEGLGFRESVNTDELGRYTVGGLPPGPYQVRSETFDEFLDELYDNIPCSIFDCDPTLASPVVVELSSTTPNIDFALRRQGAISGRVTNAATDEGLAFYRVDVRALLAEGFFSRSGRSDESGQYSIHGLPPGNYVVVTSDRSEFQDELYDDIPCPFSSCDAEDGTPVTVSLETTTAGIDFALNGFGSITGTVTDEETGTPIRSVFVRSEDTSGRFGDSTSTDESGNFVLDRLLPGTYFIWTSEFGNFRDELYDDIPCSQGECDISIGEPISVSFASTISGIDFALTRQGSIAGTVTMAESGAPIASVFIEVVNPETSSSFNGETDDDGNYLVQRLPPGNYVVLTRSNGFRDELYDDFSCSRTGCDPTVGIRVPVSLATTTTGIDFVLDRLGSISGTVREAATGSPIPFAHVQAFDSNGEFVTSGGADAAGVYVIPGLHPVAHFALASGPEEYVPQLHGGVACVFGACDVTLGSPIAVDLDATTEGIDFALDLGGSLAGTVRSEGTDDRLRGSLKIWGENGEFLGRASTDLDGRYLLQGLAAGKYFVSTESIRGSVPFARFRDELFDDLPCPDGRCDPTIGSPILVDLGVITTEIDFALNPEVEPACFPSATVLCLNDDRFRVEARWRDFFGRTGAGNGVELTDDTGYFWFFDPLNVELVVKMLDGCFEPFDTFWVFAGGLTDVEVELTVTDTSTGEIRTYDNTLGSAFEPIQDLAAFATCEGPAAGRPRVPPPFASNSGTAAGLEIEQRLAKWPEMKSGVAFPDAPRAATALTGQSPGACVANEITLCLNNDRFAVTALWDTGNQVGDGRARLLTSDTGYFWFFSPDNVEAVVKVLNACDLAPFHNFWVFAAGLTDVRVTLRVLDTETSEVQFWDNPLGAPFQPIRETGAFMACP